MCKNLLTRPSVRLVPVAIAFALAFIFLGAPAASCDVLINEILAGPTLDWNGDGAVSSRDDEWLELYNAGTIPVNLADYLMSDADSTVRYQFNGSLGPAERALVYGSQAVEWQRDNGASVAGLSLNNSGDAVRLWQIVVNDTIMVDAYVYKSHETLGDRASGREPDGGIWALFDGINPYTGGLEPGGNGCQPTPGETNKCEATQLSEETWGRIKGVYR
jgi:hypothetical protein